MGELAALASAAVWSIASLVYARLGLTIRALALNLLECTFALLMLFLVLSVWVINDPSVARWPDAQGSCLLMGSGLIGIALGDTAYFHSLNRLGPRRSLIVSALTPALTAFLASFFLREAITFGMFIGMFLTLGGIFWVIHEKHPQAGYPTLSMHHLTEWRTNPPQTTASNHPSSRPLVEWRGVAWGLLAALCHAAGNILTKKGGGTLPALSIAIFRLAAGILGLLLLVLLFGRFRESFLPLRNKHTFQMLFVATFFGTFLGVWLQIIGLRYTPSAGIASTLSSTSPLFVLPLAFFILREPLSLRAVLGAFFAICGVAVLFLI